MWGIIGQSLLNTSMKIITKVFANRLQHWYKLISMVSFEPKLYRTALHGLLNTIICVMLLRESSSFLIWTLKKCLIRGSMRGYATDHATNRFWVPMAPMDEGHF